VKSRGFEFFKGVLFPTPAFVVLAIYAWSTLGRPTDLSLNLLCVFTGLLAVGVIATAIRMWNRSRFFAYGVLSSLFLGTLSGAALMILLLMAIGSAIRG
jgi:hypothetical protein